MIDRRTLLVAAGAALAGSAAKAQNKAQNSAQNLAQGVSRITAYPFTFAALDGADIRLADHTGKPMLIVNTASQCGYTPQLTGLQKLHVRFRELFVLGVPSNDYGQEPGTGLAIAHEAKEQFGVTFPLTAPVALKGPNAHPFYKWAAAERPLERPHWNFHKYLIGQDGHVAAVFATEIEPEDAAVIAAIEKQMVSERS